MKKDTSIIELLAKPLWQMTGEEFIALHAYAHTSNEKENAKAQPVVRVKGVNAVAEYCDCSPSQVAKFLREGVLDSAILSRIGKSIVFDGDEARRRANEYQQQRVQQRVQRREKTSRK